MKGLAGFCFLCGFSGILSFGVFGYTRELWIALASHVVIMLAIYLWVCKAGDGFHLFSHGRSGRQKILGVGILFFLAGLWIAIFAPVGQEKDSMTKEAQVYFGAIFSSLGMGTMLSGVYKGEK